MAVLYSLLRESFTRLLLPYLSGDTFPFPSIEGFDSSLYSSSCGRFSLFLGQSIIVVGTSSSPPISALPNTNHKGADVSRSFLPFTLQFGPFPPFQKDVFSP